MYDSSDGRDFASSGEAESAQYLRGLVEHRHVVETLEVLSNGPISVAQMTRRVGVGRRGIAATLRILAAHGVVRTRGAGSWDTPASRDTLYVLTDRGCAVVTTLSRLAVWTMLLEGSDVEDRPDPLPDERS